MQKIDDFIRDHAHIDYCEAVINKDGFIQYVKPSHIETMIRISGKTRNEIAELMPRAEAHIDWLIEYTGCICVWSQFYKRPDDITKEQEIALKKLIVAGLVADNDIDKEFREHRKRMMLEVEKMMGRNTVPENISEEIKL